MNIQAKQLLSLSFLLFSLLPLTAQQWHASSDVPDSVWMSPAELSDYQKTATHAEVMQRLVLYTQHHPYLRLDTLGFSPEGRVIPLVVAANPLPAKDFDKQEDARPVLYLQGNIHAGEVEGKEALLILLRELSLGQHQQWLNDRIVLINPIYNTDSNDAMEEGVRPSQEDSPRMVGQRPNSQGWDLNRDGVKAEADETKALLGMLQRWDPDLLVDFHTTNGTWHGYRLTWAPAYHTAGYPSLFEYSWYQMLPELTRRVKEDYDLDFGPYGWYNFREGWPPKSIQTYNHHPRYLVNQMGLRNRMAILSETFAHDRFYHRVQAAYAFGKSILDYFTAHGKVIQGLNTEADTQVAQAIGQKRGVRFKKVPLPEPFTLRTYDYLPFKTASGDTSWVRSGQIVEYPNRLNYSAFEATQEEQVPAYYLIPKSEKAVLDLLVLHGFELKEAKNDDLKELLLFVPEEVRKAQRPFQGHYMLTVQGSYQSLSTPIEASNYIKLEVSQPLGRLAFYLLEPTSDDGLATWNFFDAHLLPVEGQKAASYPVLKGF